ncbi:hypothetical protein VOM14_19470 [Paraburkholderia sp. MPAMCS5]|uniref:hypothetical protein n=1 Tax=Paraburkholderia sp. MPAMCS5 TaxID=3112563 RepID=UPI002E186022|nr:hypothetical protein [Paraburkholderia sp. MPAMCS5]
MTQPNLQHTQTFAAEPAGAPAAAREASIATAMLGMRTVAFSMLVDRALSA